MRPKQVARMGVDAVTAQEWYLKYGDESHIWREKMFASPFGRLKGLWAPSVHGQGTRCTQLINRALVCPKKSLQPENWGRPSAKMDSAASK